MSDPDKRKSYDKYGHDGPTFKSSAFTQGRADDIFKHFFEDFGFGGADDDFFASVFGKRAGGKPSRFGSGFGGFSGFSAFGGLGDSIFSGGLGAFSSSSFSSSSFGSGNMPGKSTQTVTKTM